MRKVAQLAGVSTSTVSRVVNDHPSVAAATIASVRQAMQDLSFAPVRRRSDARHRGNGHSTATVAFLVFGTSGSQPAPAFEKLLRGVSAASAENDLSLLFSFVSDPSRLPPRILERRVIGLLLHGEQPGELVQNRLKGLPTVWLMANRQRPTWGDQVMPDNTAIGEIAAQYLLRQGHRELAYIGTTGGSWSMEIRSLAFSRFAADAGAAAHILQAPVTCPIDFWNGGNLVEAVHTLVARLATLSPRPTGVFVAEDRLLPAVDAALDRQGLSTGRGRDLEIISCNNEQPHLAGLHSMPATIDIRAESIGRRGVEQLVWRLRNMDQTERLRAMVEPVLVEPLAPAHDERIAEPALHLS